MSLDPFFGALQGFDRSSSSEAAATITSSATTLPRSSEAVTAAAAGFQPYRPTENTILSSSIIHPSAAVNNAIATPTPYAYHPAYFPSAAATHLSYG